MMSSSIRFPERVYDWATTRKPTVAETKIRREKSVDDELLLAKLGYKQVNFFLDSSSLS